MPFDIDAPVIQIADEDYAIWYRDMAENMPEYAGKTVKFKGMVATDPRLDNRSVVIGRHVMTCCEADIQYNGLVAVFASTPKLKTRDWITLTGTIKLERNKIYRTEGPVLYVEATEFAVPPKQEVATFY